jgi:hypothetical protein
MIAPRRPDGKGFIRAKTPHKRAENAGQPITKSLNAP